MYSDSEIPSDEEYENFSSRSSTCSDNGEQVYAMEDVPAANNPVMFSDAMTEFWQDREDGMYAVYEGLFMSENSPFRTTFPDEYQSTSREHGSDEELPDLCFLLHTELFIEKPPLPANGHAGDVVASEGAANGESLPLPSELRDSDIYRHSPASRFMSRYPGSCLLFPVDETTNRAQLCDNLAPQLPKEENGALVDFAVGYDSEGRPFGWAAPLTIAPNILEEIRTKYPNARLATDADMVYFLRVKRSSRSGARTKANQTAAGGERQEGCEGDDNPSPPCQLTSTSVTKLLSARLSNVDALLRCVNEAGGWDQVHFVAFDVEAALATAGCVPVPLEFAFVPVNPQHGEKMHFFTHPGYLDGPQLLQARYNSVSLHYIPCDGARFLRKDYDELANMVWETYLSDKRVILINKGGDNSPALIDPRALQWLLSAAEVCSSDDSPLPFAFPDVDDLRCFGVHTLLHAIEQSFPAQASSLQSQLEDGADGCDGACWYHGQLSAHPLTARAADHCALKDAARLQEWVESLLSAATTDKTS